MRLTLIGLTLTPISNPNTGNPKRCVQGDQPLFIYLFILTLGAVANPKKMPLFIYLFILTQMDAAKLFII